MKKSGSRDASSFGKAAPLPNEAGYGKKAVELLEKDTKEMEVQLQMLQMRMAKQAEDDANVPKTGGSRWKAARTDRGSATRYAKDVQEKHMRSTARRQEKARAQVMSLADNAMREVAAGMMAQSMTGGLSLGTEGEQFQKQPSLNMQGSATLGYGSVKAAANGGNHSGRATRVPPMQVKGGSQSGFQVKEIQQWSVQDVVDWLSHVNLSQYGSQFTENEINGPILLEISLEDLDYMSITALGHRKVLLKGIEDLRKNRRVTITFAAGDSPQKHAQVMNVMESLEEPAPAPVKKYAPRVLDPAIRARQEAEAIAAQKEAEKKLVHWSALEPLQEQQAKAGISGTHSMSNPGDGMIDEEEEKRLFREAVAEWRGEGSTKSKVKIYRDGKEVARIDTEPKADDGMWMNPTGPILGDASSDLLDPAFSDPPRSPAGALPPVHSPNVSPSTSTARTAQQQQIAAGGDLKAASMQELDEAAEARAFAAAVAEWRGAGKSNNQESSSPSTTGVGTVSQGESAENTGARKIADELAASMEQEQRRIAEEMEAKMQAIKARIAEAQMEQVKTQMKATQDRVSRNSALDDSLDDDVDDYSDYTTRAEKVAAMKKEKEGSFTFVYDSRPIDHGALLSGVPNLATEKAGTTMKSPGSFGDSPQNSARSASSFNNSPQVSFESLESPRAGAPPVITGVSTTLGLVDVNAGNEDCYVVEEDSDDE